MEVPKSMMRKKKKGERANFGRIISQAKCQLVQTSYIERIQLFLFAI